MKIIIANKDRTDDLGPALKADADAAMADPLLAPLPWSLHSLSLRDAKNEREFLDRWTALARVKSNVSLIYNSPMKPGLVGQAMWFFRGAMWRILRYQHGRVMFRQNLINSQVAATLEFQQDEIRRLRQRLDDLERKGGGAK